MAFTKRTLGPFLLTVFLGITTTEAWDLFGPRGLIKFAGQTHTATDETLSFNNRIQPILSENCYHCHGTDSATRKGGLRLDKELDAKAVRPGHRPAIVAGKPEQSEMIRRILSEKPTEAMPPRESHKPLKPGEIELLKRWIKAGAHYEPHWSLVEPTRPAVPKSGKPWSENPIDSFVMERLQKEGLVPEGEADPRTLIRRVTLDLTGLPPTPDEVDSFVKDPSKEHYGKIVDELLARPTFGENQGRIWLDAARYSDTVGLHVDNYRSIWPYRDWVIKAFNDNMPYDRFVTEQLAGDLLPDPTDDQKIATGFLRAQETTDEGGSILEEVAATMAADQVDTVSTIYLGSSMKCCACHDHKFDPYSQKDFYRMSAFFRNNKTPIMDGRRFDTPPILYIPANENDKADAERLEKEMTVAEAESKKAKQALDKETTATPERKKLLTDTMNVAKKKVGELKAKRKELMLRGKVCLIEEEKKDSVPSAYVLKRGQYDQKGEKVTAGVPEIFPQIPADQPQNRLGLARWITAKENPLAARVFVNRLWQQFFGNGIVKTSEDFGIMGDRPVNQPLLDWLATEFRDTGWDTKKMIRLMVTSSAYKQSPVITSEKRERDPENILVSRGPRFRLEGEVIRDQALAVSGLLNPKIGGPSVKPYQPDGIWEVVTMPESDTAHYTRDAGDLIYRRSMYTFWKRQAPPPQLDTMGAPTRETCTVRRVRTNTPLQALLVMNDPQYVEAARKLATDAIHATNDPSSRLDYFSQRLLARSLKEPEKKDLLTTETKLQAKYDSNPSAASDLLKIGQYPPATDIPPQQLATWTMIASIFLNLDESLNR
jgi:Protein of unknown function (DUF1553)/Protein of unknown function (DUF1549)/Planctomycete cytochrome C